MKRKCTKLPTQDFQNDCNERYDKKIDVYLDNENRESIYEVLANRKKKFKRILHEVLSGRYNDDLYGKEGFNEKTKNITAMKFKKGDNERIYCKEFHKNGKKIVMIIAHLKKSQKLTNKVKNIIESISDYEYDFK